MARKKSKRIHETHEPSTPIEVLPGKTWEARSEYELRTADAEVLRVGDYLRARGLLEGPSPDRAWARRRRKEYKRLARRRKHSEVKDGAP